MPNTVIPVRRNRPPAQRRQIIDPVHTAPVRWLAAWGIPAQDVRVVLREIPPDNRGLRGNPGSEIKQA